MATFTAGAVTGMSFDTIDVASFVLGEVVTATGSTFATTGGGITDTLTGTFQYAGSQLSGGWITGLAETYLGQTVFTLNTPYAISVSTFLGWVSGNASATAMASIFSGADVIRGSAFADQMRGYEGNDEIYGGAGGDTLSGEGGRDFIRGEDGADSLSGGAEFDDMNGNQGNDTLRGGDGGDWVVGGQHQDLLYGDAGDDLIYGNMGVDQLFGGDGADTLRGGQEGDSLAGDAGNDWLFGDRGDDVLSGGAGADTFVSFAGAGVDRIVDFNAAQGDRVMIDGGAYTLRQEGADTVVDLGGGDKVLLLGVTLSTLPAGWI